MLDKPDSSTHDTAKKAETVAVAPPCAMVIFGAGGDLTKRLVHRSGFSFDFYFWGEEFEFADKGLSRRFLVVHNDGLDHRIGFSQI